jgi:transposase
MRYELSDYEWTVIKPMLPNKPRGVPRVNDRRVLNGIFWICVRVCRGAICRRTLARTPRATTDLFAGAGLACGTSRADHWRSA